MNSNPIDIHDLTATMRATPDVPLKFSFDDHSIRPGYHVTEVKHATVRSLDCGRGTEQWDELIIQLLDGPEQSTQDYMSTSKFMGIVGAAVDTLSVDAAPTLSFEFAPGNGPIRKLTVTGISQNKDSMEVALAGEKAVCKPFQRAIAERTAANSSGSTVQSSTSKCCAGGNNNNTSSCCG